MFQWLVSTITNWFRSLTENNTMVLTPQRLSVLSTKFPALSKHWFFIAASTLSVCNQPQEIPKLYHYALKLCQFTDGSQIDHIQLAHDAIRRNERLISLSHHGQFDVIDITHIENINSIDPDINQDVQFSVSLKIREAILKSMALGGIPKAINTLMLLKNSTPIPLRSTSPVRDYSTDHIESDRQRGRKYWDNVYRKIAPRVTNQMNSAYPDLWEYTINHVYAPLLSFSEVLSPMESSLVIIACLVPQDVNPQLKGHLKGALNNGCTAEEVQEAREMSILVSEWCGVQWKDPVAQVKL